jgi:hypothetical protein
MGRLVDPAPPGYVQPEWQKWLLICGVLAIALLIVLGIFKG